jgi:predicted XRE-type DNA-binding protein
MKKKLKRTKVSAKAPLGWPSEKNFKEVKRKMKRGLASQMLPPDATPVEKVKQELCAHFIRYKRSEGITQRELARRLDATENRVSEILHYHHRQFTIDRLLGLLSKILRDVTLRVA